MDVKQLESVKYATPHWSELPGVLEIIGRQLTPRDIRTARLVCSGWRDNIGYGLKKYEWDLSYCLSDEDWRQKVQALSKLCPLLNILSLTIWGLDNKLPVRLSELQTSFKALSQLHLIFQKGLCNTVDSLPSCALKCLHSLHVHSDHYCDLSFTSQLPFLTSLRTLHLKLSSHTSASQPMRLSLLSLLVSLEELKVVTHQDYDYNASFIQMSVTREELLPLSETLVNLRSLTLASDARGFKRCGLAMLSKFSSLCALSLAARGGRSSTELELDLAFLPPKLEFLSLEDMRVTHIRADEWLAAVQKEKKQLWRTRPMLEEPFRGSSPPIDIAPQANSQPCEQMYDCQDGCHNFRSGSAPVGGGSQRGLGIRDPTSLRRASLDNGHQGGTFLGGASGSTAVAASSSTWLSGWNLQSSRSSWIPLFMAQPATTSTGFVAPVSYVSAHTTSESQPQELSLPSAPAKPVAAAVAQPSSALQVSTSSWSFSSLFWPHSAQMHVTNVLNKDEAMAAGAITAADAVDGSKESDAEECHQHSSEQIGVVGSEVMLEPRTDRSEEITAVAAAVPCEDVHHPTLGPIVMLSEQLPSDAAVLEVTIENDSVPAYAFVDDPASCFFTLYKSPKHTGLPRTLWHSSASLTDFDISGDSCSPVGGSVCPQSGCQESFKSAGSSASPKSSVCSSASQLWNSNICSNAPRDNACALTLSNSTANGFTPYLIDSRNSFQTVDGLRMSETPDLPCTSSRAPGYRCHISSPLPDVSMPSQPSSAAAEYTCTVSAGKVEDFQMRSAPYSRTSRVSGLSTELKELKLHLSASTSSLTEDLRSSESFSPKLVHQRGKEVAFNSNTSYTTTRLRPAQSDQSLHLLPALIGEPFSSKSEGTSPRLPASDQLLPEVAMKAIVPDDSTFDLAHPVPANSHSTALEISDSRNLATELELDATSSIRLVSSDITKDVADSLKGPASRAGLSNPAIFQAGAISRLGSPLKLGKTSGNGSISSRTYKNVPHSPRPSVISLLNDPMNVRNDNSQNASADSQSAAVTSGSSNTSWDLAPTDCPLSKVLPSEPVNAHAAGPFPMAVHPEPAFFPDTCTFLQISSLQSNLPPDASLFPIGLSPEPAVAPTAGPSPKALPLEPTVAPLLRHLSSLHLEGVSVSAPLLDLVGELCTRLSRLDLLSVQAMDDDMLFSIGQLTNLRHLSIDLLDSQCISLDGVSTLLALTRLGTGLHWASDELNFDQGSPEELCEAWKVVYEAA